MKDHALVADRVVVGVGCRTGVSADDADKSYVWSAREEIGCDVIVLEELVTNGNNRSGVTVKTATGSVSDGNIVVGSYVIR